MRYDVDPNDLRVSPSRPSGADPAKLQKQIIQFGASLEHARSYRRNIVEGRWVIETHHGEHPWEVIVEPDVIGKLLVVITAYPVWDD